MRLIGDCTVGDSPALAPRCTVVVAVKLDSHSKELLTWALVKVALPGDHVIALHVVDSVNETTSSLLSLVKTFDSVLSVYEGFCNLKQVTLKLKICRGSPVRKIIKREVKSYRVATLITGISKSYHRIRSSFSLAKYCAGKLSCNFSVLAVNNGKILFQRQATNIYHPDQCQDPDCNKSRQEKNLNDGVDNSLALVPYQPPGEAETNSYSTLKLKSNWGLIRRMFLSKRQNMEKPVKKTSMAQYVLKLPGFHSSAVICANQKQSNSDPLQHCSLTTDKANCSIVTYEPPYAFLSSDLFGLREKYSSTCTLFNYQELVSATSNFKPENMVGKGGSCHVYKGCLSDGTECAVKKLKLSENVVAEFVQEIEIISTLLHKNIISLFGFSSDNNHLLLVYNFLSWGSLEENLHGNRKDTSLFVWQDRFKVAVGVAEALDHLHNGSAEPVIHRDVKSSNILISEDFEPQLSDFGLATWASTSSQTIYTDVAGTFGYLAPEYFMHGKVSDKIDVYAFGVVLLELLSGRKPISNEHPKGQESLLIWAKKILMEGKVSHLLDPSLGIDYNHDQIGRMILAATLCIRHSPKFRPHINLVLRLLQGDVEVTNWARQQVQDLEEGEGLDGVFCPTNIQSHLNLALLDLEDDVEYISSSEQNISLEDYLQGRWSRSSSFS